MRGEYVQRLFHCREERDVVIDGKDRDRLVLLVSQVDGSGFEDLPVFRLCE